MTIHMWFFQDNNLQVVTEAMLVLFVATFVISVIGWLFRTLGI
jgi:hypothetical protein